MTVNLLYTSDDPLKMGKSKNTISSITCHPYEDFPIHSPVLITNYNANFISANYMYIAEFGRYYFINDIVLLPSHKCVIYGKVDVLESFKDEIGAIDCVIGKQAAGNNFNIADTEIITRAKKNVVEYNTAGSKVFHGYNTDTSKNCVISLAGAVVNSTPLDNYKLFDYNVGTWAAEWASCYIWYRQTLKPLTDFYSTVPDYEYLVSVWGANSIYIAK